MDDRKALVLQIIIQEHIKTGAPVGSGLVSEKYRLDISPATVRNEMAWLENEGWIIQPHTSAGRVPTEEAYRWFLDKIKPDQDRSLDLKELRSVLAPGGEESLKKAAKVLSRLSGNAVFWAIDRRNLYYTGISNLFSQPEFAQIEKVYDISAVIDRMEEVIEAVFDGISPGVHTLIGSDNPFGNFFSAVIGKYGVSRRTGMFGIIGPLRMDYGRNLSLARLVQEELGA